MNRKAIAYVTGLVLIMESILFLIPLFVSLLYREFDTTRAFAISIGITLAAGGLLIAFTRKSTRFYAKEGLVIVALSWIMISIFGALPFVIQGAIPNFLDAFFEIVSGFTTTGSSILTDVEAVPHGLLFWRSFTNWIGGMGVLVFMLAILPRDKAYNMHLMRAESPGPQVDKLVPRVRKSAEILYLIYFGITAVGILVLILSGMPVFDSFCISFSSAGTGGFGVLNSSIGSYTNLQQAIISIFMLACGVNFNLYYLIFIGQLKSVFKSEELKTYLAIILSAIVLITLDIHSMYSGWLMAGKDAVVQVASVITTTGFASTDFNLWPTFAKTILVLLMFCGGCASSTAGGLKVSRIVIGYKLIQKEIRTFIHPRSVRAVSMDGNILGESVTRGVCVYYVIYALIFVASLLLVSIDGFDLESTFTAVATCFNNVGPGLSLVGPTGNFSSLSYLSKLVLSFDMLAGRLEIFPMMVLLFPRAWKH
jgi:trk system potassium uptake protein